MGRFKGQKKSKQLPRPAYLKDTPVRTRPLKHKNNFRRVLSQTFKRYAPLLEESEFEETKATTTQGISNHVEHVQLDGLSSKGVDCSQHNVEDLRHPITPTKNNDGDALLPMPTPTNPMTPIPSNTFGSFGHFKLPGDDPAVPTAAMEARAASSGLEYHTPNSDSVSDGSCSPAACTTSSSSSLPSPEVFRSVGHKGTASVSLLTLDLSMEDMGLHRKVKNSTLLDVSKAKNLHMQLPLDLSNILGCSWYSTEKNLKKISPKINANMTYQVAQAPVQTLIKEPQGTRTLDEGFKPCLCSSALKRPTIPGQARAHLFNFSCAEDRVLFFQGLRERYARIRNVPPFLHDGGRQQKHAGPKPGTYFSKVSAHKCVL